MRLTRSALHLGLLCILALIFFGAAMAAAYRLHAERAVQDSSLRVGAWSSTEAERELLTLYGMALRHSVDPAEFSKNVTTVMTQDRVAHDQQTLQRRYTETMALFLLVLATGSAMIVALVLQLRRSRCLVSRLTDAETKLSHRLAALDAASEGIAVLDAEGCFTYANRTHAQLYGFETGAALEGLSWRDLYEPGEADKLQEIARAAIRETGGWSGEAVGRRTDGGGFDQRVSLAGLPDGGLLCVVTDITQAKAAATERERLTGQLHQARKLEAIGSLAGGIAHDFNNILASILGHAHLLNDLLPVDGEAHALLDRIQVGGERAVALVSQILAFSRRDGEERGDVRLALVVEETIGLLRAVLPSTITLECTGTQSGALVHANASQLGQVLMNLCVNARDAIGSGHGRIMVSLDEIETTGEFADDLDAHGTVVEGIGTVRMEAGRTGGTRLWVGVLKHPGRHVRLRVADTGCGIPADVMERMFEPFFTTKPVGSGTGLGLSATLGIVLSADGALTVQSRSGDGTLFEIFLPIREHAPTPRRPAPKPVLPGGHARVLVVDDEADIVQMSALVLRRLGYEVRTCSGAGEVMELMAGGDAWDLVISDLTMPGMTGLELLRHLRLTHPDLPFILCTGLIEAAVKAAVEDMGGRVMLKPVPITELARTVAAALAKIPA